MDGVPHQLMECVYKSDDKFYLHDLSDEHLLWHRQEYLTLLLPYIIRSIV